MVKRELHSRKGFVSSDEMVEKRINRLGKKHTPQIQARGTHGKTKLSLMKCNVCGGEGAEVVTDDTHGKYVECKHCNALLDGERYSGTWKADMGSKYEN